MAIEQGNQWYSRSFWERWQKKEVDNVAKYMVNVTNPTIIPHSDAHGMNQTVIPTEHSNEVIPWSAVPMLVNNTGNVDMGRFPSLTVLKRSIRAILGTQLTGTSNEATLLTPQDPVNETDAPDRFMGNVIRIFRRRLLNLLDRSTEAVGPHSSDSIVNLTVSVVQNASQAMVAQKSEEVGDQDNVKRGLLTRTIAAVSKFTVGKQARQTEQRGDHASTAPSQLLVPSLESEVSSSNSLAKQVPQKGLTAAQQEESRDTPFRWMVGKLAFQLLTLVKQLQYVDRTGQFTNALPSHDMGASASELSEGSALIYDTSIPEEINEFANMTSTQHTSTLFRNLITAGKQIIIESAGATRNLVGKVPTIWRTTNVTAAVVAERLTNEPALADDKQIASEDSPALSVSQRMWNAIPYLRGSDSLVSTSALERSGAVINGNNTPASDASGAQQVLLVGNKGTQQRRSSTATATKSAANNNTIIEQVTAEFARLLPSSADFAHIATRRTELAVSAASSVTSEAAAQQFVKYIGLNALLAAITERGAGTVAVGPTEAVKSLNTLMRFDKSVAALLASKAEVVSALCDMIEAPLKGFRSLLSHADRKRNLDAQREATAIVERMIRSSDTAVNLLRNNDRLRKALSSIAQFDIAPPAAGTYAPSAASTWASEAVAELQQVQEGKVDTKAQNAKTYKVRRQSNTTTVAEYEDLHTRQMARVASWGLGGVTWRPRMPGQKGLRILSLDGGGTRGVLSIAYLKEIMKRVNRNLEPHQMFDIICGTSTGGIIAALLGAQRASLAEAEVLYDAFIDKIFAQRSNLRLVTEQAAYDGRDWEKILYDMCGDQLLIDSNQHDCARFFCVSTKVNVNPPLPNLWRNYNYPPGQISRYPGACRVNTFTAIRATTAAPTFFTPVQWESGLYCDGALVANNPTAIALQEAKVYFFHTYFVYVKNMLFSLPPSVRAFVCAELNVSV